MNLKDDRAAEILTDALDALKLTEKNRKLAEQYLEEPEDGLLAQTEYQDFAELPEMEREACRTWCRELEGVEELVSRYAACMAAVGKASACYVLVKNRDLDWLSKLLSMEQKTAFRAGLYAHASWTLEQSSLSVLADTGKKDPEVLVCAMELCCGADYASRMLLEAEYLYCASLASDKNECTGRTEDNLEQRLLKRLPELFKGKSWRTGSCRMRSRKGGNGRHFLRTRSFGLRRCLRPAGWPLAGAVCEETGPASVCTGLIWGRYEGGVLKETFRYMENGSFTTAEEEEYAFPEEGTIGLIHPAELSAWKEQLTDYEMEQPVDQLSRPVYATADEEAAETELVRFQGITLNGLSLSGKLLAQGWSRGPAGDHGEYRTFFREDGETGVTLSFSGYGVTCENMDVTVYEAVFCRIGAGADGTDGKEKLFLGEVNDRYFSEIVLQIAAAVGAGKNRQKNKE